MERHRFQLVSKTLSPPSVSMSGHFQAASKTVAEANVTWKDKFNPGEKGIKAYSTPNASPYFCMPCQDAGGRSQLGDEQFEHTNRNIVQRVLCLATVPSRL